MKAIGTAVASTIVCTLLSGCVFSHHSHLSYQGSDVSPHQVAQVQPGVTTKEWVLENLGVPDRIHAQRGGLEVFEYVGKTLKKSDSDFILLFSWESERILEKAVTRVVLREGIVESIDMTSGEGEQS